MRPLLLRADDVLRARPWVVHGNEITVRLLYLVLMVMVFGMAYGAVMGTSGGFVGERFWQVVYSAVKVPFLLLATFLISLPSFFVVNTLMGLRDDFAEALRALAATQAGLTIILASLAPFTALWYVSLEHHHAAVLFNAGMFGVASFAAQALLRRFYRPLIQRRSRHRLMMWSWLVIYAFVGIQMGWVLRPFIGNPNLPTRFFREGAWGNAYEKLVQIIIGVLPG